MPGGAPHGRRGDRAQLRVWQARGLLPHQRRGPGEVLLADGHRELRRRRPHGGGRARRHAARGAADGRAAGRAAVFRRDELQDDVRRARPHHPRQGPAGLPARPVLLAPAGRDVRLRPAALPLPERHAGGGRQQGAPGQGRGRGARASGHGQDHHAGGGRLRDPAAREPGAGVRPVEHGRRLDLGAAGGPRRQRAANRQPHARGRQDAVVHLRAALRGPPGLSPPMGHPQGHPRAAAEPPPGRRQVSPEAGEPEGARPTGCSTA